MSFILDALRKSERERQRGEVPAISSVPLAVPATKAPAWAIAAVVLLAAALAAVGWAWWQASSAHGNAPSSAASADSREAAPVANEHPSVQPSSAHEPPRPTPRTEAVASTALRDLAAAATAAAPSRAQSTAETEAQAEAENPLLRPSLGELRAEGVAVPALTLELHVYSKNPAERFVFINGHRYQEGEKLAEGPSLLRILPAGVLLSLDGREFLLPQ